MISANSQNKVQAIENARIVTPSGVIANGSLVIKGNCIHEVNRYPRVTDVANRIDIEGSWLLPGLVDLHGDDIERHLHPREEARVPTQSAMSTCDLENISAGITTKFHALAFENPPIASRSIETCNDVISSLSDSDHLLANHKVHARCQATSRSSIHEINKHLEEGKLDLISIMDHSPGKGQFADVSAFNSRYSSVGATRGNLEAQQFVKERVSQDAKMDHPRIENLISRANAQNITVASHDDEGECEVKRAFRLGVGICEYPVTMDAAKHAVELGIVTAMGAPNVVRGESLWGNLNAREAINAGVVDILCSDYHPYSLLKSLFVDTGEPFHTKVSRVTWNPAKTMGYLDRGRIIKEAKADLIVVDEECVPSVERVLVGGKEVFRRKSN